MDRVSFPLIMAGLALALGHAVATAAGTQPVLGFTKTGQPSIITLTGQPASVPGFRSAQWGMTPDEVRLALAKDFGGARAGAMIDDPVGGTTALIAPMASLAPGPVPAAISYIFDARTSRLVHVNLDWTIAAPTAADRAALTTAGSTIVAGFIGNFWRLGSVMRGVVVKPDLVILFAGADERGGGVDVRLGGVAYAMAASAAAKPMALPAGPASLHVGFSAPDAAKRSTNIQPGAF